MKKNLLLSVLFTFAMFSVVLQSNSAESLVYKVSKEDIPPQVVVNSFISIFGDVPVIQWKLRSDGTWRAHFNNNGILWEATFSADGALLKSEPSKRRGKK